jgi:2-keto-4-pentenoate hydratase/2-oxohepta-3-ene-1,7-dioic acid hydratase in catechol pathway
VGERASAIDRWPGEEPLPGGELVSSGTPTEAQLIAPGETWTATVDGIDLGEITLRTTA